MDRVTKPRWEHTVRGEILMREPGELAYEIRPWGTAPHEVVFLEWVEDPDPVRIDPWYALVINRAGRVEAVHQNFLYPTKNRRTIQDG